VSGAPAADDGSQHDATPISVAAPVRAVADVQDVKQQTLARRRQTERMRRSTVPAARRDRTSRRAAGDHVAAGGHGEAEGAIRTMSPKTVRALSEQLARRTQALRLLDPNGEIDRTVRQFEQLNRSEVHRRCASSTTS
jgi:hypothetical protein